MFFLVKFVGKSLLFGGAAALGAVAVKRFVNTKAPEPQVTSGWTEPALDRHDTSPFPASGSAPAPIDAASDAVAAVNAAVAAALAAERAQEQEEAEVRAVEAFEAEAAIRAVEDAIAQANRDAAESDAAVRAVEDAIEQANRDAAEADAAVRAVEDSIKQANRDAIETDKSSIQEESTQSSPASAFAEQPAPANMSTPRWVKGDGSHSCPDEYPVKGKVSSMIYHLPDGPHYSRTIPDVCYMTPEDAKLAGYRGSEARRHSNS